MSDIKTTITAGNSKIWTADQLMFYPNGSVLKYGPNAADVYNSETYPLIDSFTDTADPSAYNMITSAAGGQFLYDLIISTSSDTSAITDILEADYVKKTNTINGHDYTTSDAIVLTASDIGLGNVPNYSASNTGSSDTELATTSYVDTKVTKLDTTTSNDNVAPYTDRMDKPITITLDGDFTGVITKANGATATHWDKGDILIETNANISPTLSVTGSGHNNPTTTFNNLDDATIDLNINTSTDTVSGIVLLSDATDSVDSVADGVAATPLAVKTAYELANDALPLSGGTMSGDIIMPVNTGIGDGGTRSLIFHDSTNNNTTLTTDDTILLAADNNKMHGAGDGEGVWLSAGYNVFKVLTNGPSTSINGITYNDHVIYHDGNDNSLVKYNDAGNGVISTTTAIISGYGYGGVGMTLTDGYGNANLTFNHVNARPEVSGNSGRITVNTNSTAEESVMTFETLTGAVGDGTVQDTIARFGIKDDYVYLPNNNALRLGPVDDNNVEHVWDGANYYTDISKNGKWYIRDHNSSNANRFILDSNTGSFSLGSTILPLTNNNQDIGNSSFYFDTAYINDVKGNADTATKLANPINLTVTLDGDTSGTTTVSLDGSGDQTISVDTTIDQSKVVPSGSNPNILRDPTFKVSETKQTSGTVTGGNYILDAWKLPTGTVSTNWSFTTEGYLKLTTSNLNNALGIEQSIDVDSTILRQRTFTLTAEVEVGASPSGNFNMVLNVNGTPTNIGSQPIIANDVNYINITGTIPDTIDATTLNTLDLIFNPGVGYSPIFRWIKLEEGDRATQFNAPDYDIEYFKVHNYKTVVASSVPSNPLTNAIYYIPE